MDFMTWIRAEWDRVFAVLALLAGVVLVVVGYLGVANSPFIAEQLAYIVSGGIGGLLCFGLGLGLLLSADMHDEWRKLDRLETLIRQNLPAMEADVRSPKASSAPPRRQVTSNVALSAELATDAPSAWDRSAITILGTFAVAAAIFAGWDRAAEATGMSWALPGVWIAAGALALGGIGLATKIGMLRSRIIRRTRQLSRSLAVANSAVVEVANPHLQEGVLVVEGLKYFHRNDCPTMAGASARLVGIAEAGPAFAPCPLCDSGAVE